MAKWIVIDCYSVVDIFNRMPDDYLLENGFEKEDIANLICTDRESYWWNKYLREKQEGIMIYVMNDDYLTPRKYSRDKNLLLACDSNRLNSFENYTPDRYLVWRDVRTQVKFILERFIGEFMFDIRQSHPNDNWKVVDVTMEEVCEECSDVVERGSLKYEPTRGRVCETCIPRKTKSSEKEAGYIYFIKEPQTGLVKIGRSTDVERRVQSLQIGMPFDMEVVFKFYSDDYRLSETICHKFFESENVRGEWYRLSEKDIEWVKSNYNSLTKTVKVG